jgi:glycosyltransferase involved in cell wall biosynthesis
MNLLRTAVLIPCYNEQATIAAVVGGFQAALPGAVIHVYDNNSTDRTREEAAAAGAAVWTEPRQGKGKVVRRMFADIEADAYVLVDGDGTYDAADAPAIWTRYCGTGLMWLPASASRRLRAPTGQVIASGTGP